METNKEVKTCYAYVDTEMAQFEEVAGTCSNKDNVDEACCTVRSVTLGLMYIIGMSYFHSWGNFQNYPLFFGSVLVVVSAFPLGHLWTLIIPKSKPFTLKEHGLILVMANVAYMYQSIFANATLTTLKVLEKEGNSVVYYLFSAVSLQYLGFGLAGILRRFLVWPSEVIWPQNLPLIAVLRTLHEHNTSIRQVLYDTKVRSLKVRLVNNRLLFFVLISLIAFIYEWFPLYIMPILTYFSWMCLIKPTDNHLAQLTAVHGLAMGGGGLTLDWQQVTQYLGSPLIVPIWAINNIGFGFVLIVWKIVPIVYGTNVRGFLKYPIGGALQTDFTALSIVTTFISFACVEAVFVHALLFHSIDIYEQFRTKTLAHMGNDLHARMISLYKTVPDWCYLQLFALALIVSCVTCDYAGWLPWYYVLLSVFIGSLFALPFGLVSSITGQLLHNLPVYYICLLISQSLFFEAPAKNMYTFIALSYITYVETLSLVQDMKLAHYLKMSPRSLCFAQCLASFVCPIFSIGIRYIYSKDTQSHTDGSVFINTRIGWAISNDNNRFFNGTNLNNRDLLWGFLIGAFLPIPGWILSHYRCFRWLSKLHWPLILVTLGWMPSIVPAGSLFTWLVIGLSIYYTLGKYHWRQRHVYLVSAGLDLGLNITLMIVNLSLKDKNIFFSTMVGKSKYNSYRQLFKICTNMVNIFN